MSRVAQPELKSKSLLPRALSPRGICAHRIRTEFMDRRLFLHLQGGRNVSGVLRGFDMFLNLVVDNAFEELGGGVRKPCGMVVSRDLVSWFRPVSCRIMLSSYTSKPVSLLRCNSTHSFYTGCINFRTSQSFLSNSVDVNLTDCSLQVIRGNSVSSMELLDSMRV